MSSDEDPPPPPQFEDEDNNDISAQTYADSSNTMQQDNAHIQQQLHEAQNQIEVLMLGAEQDAIKSMMIVTFFKY